MQARDKNWKLKLRYGLIKTKFHHYTLIAPAVVKKQLDAFSCPPGNAYIGMNVWASSSKEAFDIFNSKADQLGINIYSGIESFVTDPVERPLDVPYCYNINFTPFNVN